MDLSADEVFPHPESIKEGAQAQPPTIDPLDQRQQLEGPLGIAAGDEPEGPLLESGPAARSPTPGGEAAGSHPSSAGLVANNAADLLEASREEHEMRNTSAHKYFGMPQNNVKANQLEHLRRSDFDKYRRFAQKWLKRRNDMQRQQQGQLKQAQPKQAQQQPHQTLRQLRPPSPAHNETPEQSNQRQSLPGQSPQAFLHQSSRLARNQQQDLGFLHQQLQYGTDLAPPPNQPYPSQQQPNSASGGQPNKGITGQGGLPPQEGMMAMARRQVQAFALAQGMQPSGGANPPVSQPSVPATRVADEAIDLTDDNAAPAAAPPPATLPGGVSGNAQLGNDQDQDWRAYQGYTQRQQQHNAQQFHQLHQQQVFQQLQEQQQQQPQQQQQQHPAVDVHAHLQHMQMLQNGSGAAAVSHGALGLSHQQQALPYPHEAAHRKLPDYSNNHARMKRPRYYEERPRYEADENQAGTVTFSLISTTFFTAKIRKPTPASVHTYFKLTPGATYEEKDRRWKFPLGAHENLAGALSRQGVQVVPVPRQAIAAATLATEPDQASGDQKEPSVNLCEEMVPECIRKHLAPFQKEGVEFVLKKEGRAMIADEMGLGKTIQAVSCAAAYEAEWPLLIICPSSARYHWEHELLKWLDEDSITKKEIMVVCKSKQDLNRGVTKVVIISYELVNRMREELDLFNFGVVVCDECHYLKNQRAARTKAIVPLATKARRAILLSGTPALSRPSELFTQLNLLSASMWASFRDFGKRYCAGKNKGKKGKKGKFGADYSGASHIAELHALLGATVMVRRLKKNILKHLPPKQRSLVAVHVDDEGARRELQADLKLLATRHHARLGRLAKQHGDNLSENGSRGLSQATEVAPSALVPRTTKPATDAPKGKGNGRQPKVAPGTGRVTRLSALPPASSPLLSPQTNGSVNDSPSEPGVGSERDIAEMTKTELAQERRSLLMKLFADTGTAKIPAVIRHVSGILADEMTGGKVLVFAHHRNVLDALEKSVVLTGRVEYIRIDGRTKPKDRQDLVDTFQTNPSVRIALLGLTAAGIGITLTAASRVVFAELYWTPAQLLQAEDRCHRIGQATVVNVQYLVAKGSLDDALWPLIQEKIKLLGEMVEGEGEANQMEVNSGDSKQPKRISPVTSPNESGTREVEAVPGERSKSVASAEAKGVDPATEEARATLKGLQASVIENAQELAVEDMRHELDDEGRREFFEEQGDDGECGAGDGGGSDGYSSGYSDGRGGQEGEDTMVCDLADSDEDDKDDVICDLADAQESDGVDAWPQHKRMRLEQPRGSPPGPIGLEATIELAEAKAASGESSRSTFKLEEVIDLLSSDEAESGDVAMGTSPELSTLAEETALVAGGGGAGLAHTGNCTHPGCVDRCKCIS